jgi:hypothetical protein
VLQAALVLLLPLLPCPKRHKYSVALNLGWPLERRPLGQRNLRMLRGYQTRGMGLMGC